jgi:hypothetical protein
MTQTIKIADCDVVFLSYDEPNADQNYNQLLTFIPWAERVHGVKGSDAAHKACANLATTDRVVIVDGDNYMVRGGFLDQIIQINDDAVDLSNSVISWPSRNIINGLVYGNGGIKCWHRDTILTMQTHEAADPTNIRAQVDFCWDITYIPLDTTFTDIRNNLTPHQAWRAGFREGVKMSLNEGVKVEHLEQLWKGNLNRLAIWMMVGSDVDNGEWAMYGARLGCYMTQFTDWGHVNVRDFDYLDDLWNVSVKNLSLNTLREKSIELGNIINSQLVIGEPFSSEQSKFFKRFDFNVKRQSSLINLIEHTNE